MPGRKGNLETNFAIKDGWYGVTVMSFFLLCYFKFKVIDYISQISRKWVKLQK